MPNEVSDLSRFLPDRWKFTENTKNKELLEMLFKTYWELSKNFEITEETDFGFGYSFEAMVKHLQDDDKEGKIIAEALKAGISEVLRQRNGLL